MMRLALTAMTTAMLTGCLATVSTDPNAPRSRPPPGQDQSGPSEPPPPAEQRYSFWDTSGWRYFGAINFSPNDTEAFISLPRDQGNLNRIMLVVAAGDVFIKDIRVTYVEGGRPRDMQVRHAFGESSRTSAVEIPGETRTVDKIGIQYGKAAGARLELWGQ